MEKSVPSKLSRSKPTYPWITPLKSEDLLTGKIRLGMKARKTNNQKDRDQYRKLKALAQKTATCVG